MIYDQNTKTSASDANQAGLNADNASKTNPFLTKHDLFKDGIVQIIMIAPNGTKWKKTVDNAGNWLTVQV